MTQKKNTTYTTSPNIHRKVTFITKVNHPIIEDFGLSFIFCCISLYFSIHVLYFCCQMPHNEITKHADFPPKFNDMACRIYLLDFHYKSIKPYVFSL